MSSAQNLQRKIVVLKFSMKKQKREQILNTSENQEYSHTSVTVVFIVRQKMNDLISA